MNDAHRSLCPINLALEVFGDRWTLLILRDILFGGRRHFREMLQLQEGISSNILADRLKMLVEQGLLTKADDPTHKQKAIYSLTEKGIALLPIFIQIGYWGRSYLGPSEEMSVRSEIIEEGGPPLWEKLADELRAVHLRPSPVVETPTLDLLRQSPEALLAKRRVDRRRRGARA